jgi:hypothetical protein
MDLYTSTNGISRHPQRHRVLLPICFQKKLLKINMQGVHFYNARFLVYVYTLCDTL